MSGLRRLHHPGVGGGPIGGEKWKMGVGLVVGLGPLGVGVGPPLKGTGRPHRENGTKVDVLPGE